MLRFSTLLGAVALSFSLAACGDDGGSEDSSSTSADSSESSEGESGDTGPSACEMDFVTKDNPSAEDAMTDFGTPCSTDADCSALGTGATCYTDVLGVFELPGGYCSKPCALPDTNTTFINDAEDCDPNGGVSCVGAAGVFTACARPCSEDSNCSREGYGCVRMPVISGPDDQTFCLMNEAECCLLDDDACSAPP